MIQQLALKNATLRKFCLSLKGGRLFTRSLNQDVVRCFGLAARKRQRRDNVWIPTVNIKAHDGNTDATRLLIRAGYLRQAYSGIFHLLPLGLRVQGKLELLIDKHMQSIDASKVSLSSISSQNLWARSGRLMPGSELFKFQDRKGSKWLLAPTHEEEITTLVKDVVHSSAQLPVRVYQISRKYRDEKRPRGGLLRGKEFIMKDLYTFDTTPAQAHATYDLVRAAYRNLFDELAVPYIEARADSGNMGGSLSHEYHFPSPVGEDDVISCEGCDYARNEEWVPECSIATSDIDLNTEANPDSNDYEHLVVSEFTNRSSNALVKVFAPKKISSGEVVGLNSFAVKAAMDTILQLDTGLETPQKTFMEADGQEESAQKVVYYLFDPSMNEMTINGIIARDRPWLAEHDLLGKLVRFSDELESNLSLLKQSTGDSCPQCYYGKLQVHKAIEVGHTFHLGTRYSSKLGLTIKQVQDSGEPIAVEMGCHGIGVSRLVAAIASACSDKVGLNWPASIAPYQVVIVVDGGDADRLAAAEGLYDQISESFDVLLDDRSGVSNGYKLKDADMIGYPVIVIVGRAFANGQVEIQCRSRNLRNTTGIGEASAEVSHTLHSLLNSVQ